MLGRPKPSQRWLLRGGLLLQLDPPKVEAQDLRVADGKIEEIGTELTPMPGEEVLELEGRWLMPGLVCAHTHLYSALSCGMPMSSKQATLSPSSDAPMSQPLSPPAPTPFADMLGRVWWRLDAALDLEAVEVSALVGGVGALRAGVTTLVDHHASPSAIEESLVCLDSALEQLGLRRVLCYEITDRGGPEKAAAGLRAHERLLEKLGGARRGGHTAVMIGAHANFTLSDATLQRCAALAKEADVGLHIHVAEARDDALVTGENVVSRLARLGALRPGSILAHCVHTDAEDLQRIADAGAWISHQPRSNMNNAVGYAPVELFPEQTMLGTDGIGADMFAELQAAWFRAQEGGVSWSPQRWLHALQQGAAFAGQALEVSLGRLEVGGGADLVLMQPAPGPPLRAENLGAAAIFRFSSGLIRSVMIDGQWRLWDGQLVDLDVAALDARAQQVAQDIWARME